MPILFQRPSQFFSDIQKRSIRTAPIIAISTEYPGDLPRKVAINGDTIESSSFINMQEVIDRLDLLEDGIHELKDAVQTSDKVKTTLQWCLTSVRKLLRGSDAALRVVRDLKQDYEVDYELHVRENLGAWSFENCVTCMKIRSILKPYNAAEDPVLSSLKEEMDLLAYLDALDGGQTAEQGDVDRGSRSGYYRVLHRVVDSMKTLSGERSEGTEHMRRAAQYACTEMCRYWNGGLPAYVLSFSASAPIALLSSEDVFRDMWRAIREKKYKKAVRGRGTPQSAQSSVCSGSQQSRGLDTGSTIKTPRAGLSPYTSSYNTRRSPGNALRSDINSALERDSVQEQDELSEPSDLDIDTNGKSGPSADGAEEAWDLAGLRAFRMLNADQNDRYSEVESVTESNRSTASASIASKTRLLQPEGARSQGNGHSRPPLQVSKSLHVAEAAGSSRSHSLPPQASSGTKRSIREADPAEGSSSRSSLPPSQQPAPSSSSKSPQKQRPRH